MYKIWTDSDKNRLYIDVGEQNGGDMTSLPGDADSACRKLDTHFTCLIHFQPGILLPRQDEGAIFQLQDTLCSHGLQKAVYVRPEGSVLGRFQLEMLHIHSECPGENAFSREEGEAILDQG